MMRAPLFLAALLFAAPVFAGPTTPAQVNGGVYNATPPTLSDKQSGVFQLDANGNLKANIAGGSITASTSAKATAAAPSYVEGSTDVLSMDLAGNLRVINPLPTGAATAANQATEITALGTLNTTLGSPFQDGGTIGNTSFAATQGTSPWVVSGTATVSGTVAATQSGTWDIGTLTGITNALPAGTNLLGKVGIDQTTPGTTNGVVNNAGENHIGEVGGNQITVQVAQTVTATTYTAGFSVGGLMTVANAARVSSTAGAPGTGGLLQSVVINAKSAQTTQIDVFIFSANPTASTCTDDSAFALNVADFDKVLGVAHVVDWTDGNTASVGQAQNLAMPYSLVSATSFYACAVTRSTPTYASTSGISIGFRMIRN
jgi:hypothetical protein